MKKADECGARHDDWHRNSDGRNSNRREDCSRAQDRHDRGNHYGWERGNHYGRDKNGGNPGYNDDQSGDRLD